MSDVVTLVLDPDTRCRAREAGIYLAQLEDVHAKLARSLDGATPEELSWQMQPGANTIGMLLAHIAIAQVHLVDVGVRVLRESDVRAVLGMGADGDGMPLPAGAAPPASLAGHTAQDFREMLGRARDHALRHVTALSEEALDRRFERHPPNVPMRLYNVRWMLHHLQEHVTGHLGQIQLLRAAYRQRQ